MPYATQSDMTDRYGEQELIEQTDRTNTGLVDATVVARVLSDASAMIDGFMASRYVLPLASVPPLLVGLCCDLARYALYPDAVPTAVADRYKDAIARLKEIAAGTIKLDLETPAVAHSGLVELETSPRLFSRANR